MEEVKPIIMEKGEIKWSDKSIFLKKLSGIPTQRSRCIIFTGKNLLKKTLLLEHLMKDFRLIIAVKHGLENPDVRINRVWAKSAYHESEAL